MSDNLLFDNFILADELLAKDLESLEPFLPVNSNLCGKLVSSLESPVTFNERFKVTLLPFFVPDFNLSSCKLDSFTFKLL